MHYSYIVEMHSQSVPSNVQIAARALTTDGMQRTKVHRRSLY